MIVIGILLGGVLPFSNMINVLLPVRGVVGILLIVLVFAALARVKKKSAVKEVEAEGIECESTEDATEHI